MGKLGCWRPRSGLELAGAGADAGVAGVDAGVAGDGGTSLWIKAKV